MQERSREVEHIPGGVHRSQAGEVGVARAIRAGHARRQLGKAALRPGIVVRVVQAARLGSFEIAKHCIGIGRDDQVLRASDRAKATIGQFAVVALHINRLQAQHVRGLLHPHRHRLEAAGHVHRNPCTLHIRPGIEHAPQPAIHIQRGAVVAVWFQPAVRRPAQQLSNIVWHRARVVGEQKRHALHRKRAE